jgi:7-cyano-7-deazaguanine synthase in queuosine biosynthesis
VTHEVAVVYEHLPKGSALYLRPSLNLITGESDFRRSFGELTSLETDVLTFAGAVYACDLAVKRGRNEDVARSIKLSIPVFNLPLFHLIHDKILFALYSLSHDAWEIDFRQRQGINKVSAPKYRKSSTGKVLLLSGGLDSFAAALQLGTVDENTQLVSHITANPAVRASQEQIWQYLQQQYGGRFLRTAFYVSGRNKEAKGYSFPSDRDREDTQRTRTFLFLMLAGLTANRLGYRDIIFLAENGQLAINLPLTYARIGAFSTHTAHPDFIQCMSEILSILFSYRIDIINPFVYRTKAEVVRSAVTQHLNAAKRTVSCWKASRLTGDKTHCGYCVPCLTRRIAVEANNVSISEYERDILAEAIGLLDPDDEGKRNLMDLAEFVKLFERRVSKALMTETFPDLISKNIDVDKAIDMYRRFAIEARSVFDRYPTIKNLVQ